MEIESIMEIWVLGILIVGSLFLLSFGLFHTIIETRKVYLEWKIEMIKHKQELRYLKHNE